MKENISGPGFVMTRETANIAPVSRETVSYWAKILLPTDSVVIEGAFTVVDEDITHYLVDGGMVCVVPQKKLLESK